MAKNASQKQDTVKSASQETTKTAKTGETAKAANDRDSGKKNTKTRTAIVLVIGLIVVVAMFALNASILAKLTVEKIASQTLGVEVSIAGLDVNLQERQINVSGITVANPQGYQSDHAFTIDAVSIAAADITKEVLVFDQIRVSGTRVNLEVRPDRTNLIEIHENLNSAASTSEPAETPVKVVIRELIIEDAVLYPAVTLAQSELQPATMPDIRITGIGEDTGGVLPSEAMTAITERVVAVAMHQAVRENYLRGMEGEALTRIESALGLSSGFLKNFGDKVKGLFGN